jgi:hypothetical protein
MTAEPHYRDIYDEAFRYLLSFDRVDEGLIERHLSQWQEGDASNLSELYYGLLTACQNRQGMPNSIGDLEELDDYLYGFSPTAVIEAYDSWKDFFDTLSENDEYTPPGRMERDNPRNYWVQFSKSILSGAHFLHRFDGIDEFDEFVESFYASEYTRYSLPLLLGEEIHGLQFALACDFLKENGYPEFAKPDVHLKDIFLGTGLSESDDDFDIFIDIIRFADRIDELPYRVDKVFWLVGSGRFYLESPEVTVSTNKQEFIDRVLALSQ